MYYLYRPLLIAVMWLPALTLHAQVDRALKLIEQGNYTEAEPILRSALSDEKDQVFGYYGLAVLYAEPEFTAHRLDSAYRYIEAADAAYKALDYKDRGKVTKDISTSSMRKQRTEILKTALAEAEAGNTIAAYQKFLDNYPGSGSRYEGKAVEARNRLAYEAARTEDTERAYTALLEAYGEDLKKKNLNLYETIQKLQFERYVDERGWTGYEAFAKQYPDHVYVRDSLYEEFKGLWYGPVADYRAFIDNYPAAPITRYAVDSLGMRLIEQADTVLSRQFLQEFPDHPARNDVYGTWYESLKVRFQSMSDLERFRTNNPDFPYPERLTADEELFLDKSLEKLQVGKALGAFRAFIDKYPEYSRIDTVWWRYYLTYKNERPGAENLDRFLSVHPDFPFPDAIAQDRLAFQGTADRRRWENLKAGQGTAELFRYIKAQAESPFRDSAVDLLAVRLLDEGQFQSVAGFLKDFPEHPRRPELLLKLWEEFPDKDHGPAISGFMESYPDYPQPDVLEKALVEVPLTDEEVMTFDEDKRAGFVRYIQRHAPEPKAFDALWRMVAVHFESEEWDVVHETMQSFAKDFGDQHPEFNQWLSAFDAKNRGKVEGISPKINTAQEEYSAVITADDQKIYFCRNTGTGEINEDIYVASRGANGQWQEAIPLSELVTADNEAPEAISADGNRMITFVEGRICTSEKTREGWSKPVPLSKNINRSNWQADARMTADNKAIIFTSEVGVLRGNKDLYISLLQEDGTWGPAVSIGDSLNTEKDDRSPFLHPDMKTLYFSSAGHRGLGGLDIFVSKRLDESWTNWSKPVNLGPGVNTIANDWSFKVTTDGQQGYFNILSKNGGGDIFIMPLPEKFRPEPVATVSGRLTSSTGDPIEADINWVNLVTGEIIQVTTSDPADGNFFATLPSLGRYGYTIKKDGYFPISGNLDFSEKLYHHRLDKAMTIITVEEMLDKDIAVPLNNLFFETAKYAIQPESFPELNGLADWLQENDLTIQVHGHTDTVGEDADNLVLSENRAKAVRTYLLERGITPERIVAAGFGEQHPVADNLTPEGRAQNRRVEIRIRR